MSSIRHRRLDGVGVLVVIEIVTSVALLLVTQNPQVVLLKPSLYTLLTALFLYATCVVGRPMGYEAATPLATGGDPLRLRAYRAAWEYSAAFRRRERLVTAVFATALLLEAVARVVIVLALPADAVGRALVAGQLPGVALVVGALLFARSQVPALTRIVDAEQLRLDPTVDDVIDPSPDEVVRVPRRLCLSASLSARVRLRKASVLQAPIIAPSRPRAVTLPS